MDFANKATRIRLTDFKTPQMRAFHVTWFAFFLCFFGWFGIAPLMAVVREELLLTKAQIGNTIIASVAITVLVRLLIGPLCDRYGARLVYSALLIFGSIPVMGIGLANSYETFLLFRLAIGAIGASFVITQYHTSVMFAPNCVGTANATTAGWGNLGGGVTQMAMPLVFAAMLTFGADKFLGWRLACRSRVALVPDGITPTIFSPRTRRTAIQRLRERGKSEPGQGRVDVFQTRGEGHRVWALFVIYAACFGVELTINNVAALYYFDHFKLDIKTAGLIAGLFGLMNIFARTLGGVFSDKVAVRGGLKGRVWFMGIVIFLEGIALMIFANMETLLLAVPAMIIFSLFVQMAEGATYGIVPFMNKKALGAVAGIVAAGGNAGAVEPASWFRAEGLRRRSPFLLGATVAPVPSGGLRCSSHP